MHRIQSKVILMNFIYDLYCIRSMQSPPIIILEDEKKSPIPPRQHPFFFLTKDTQTFSVLRVRGILQKLQYFLRHVYVFVEQWRSLPLTLP